MRSSRPFWLGEDKRTWDHVRIHVQLFRDERLGSTEIAVYGGLAVHADAGSGEARPSLATLGSYVGCHEQTVRRVLRRLEELGYIEVEQRLGKASTYRLLPPPGTPSKSRRGGDSTPSKKRPTPLPKTDGVPLPNHVDELEPVNENQELIPPNPHASVGEPKKKTAKPNPRSNGTNPRAIKAQQEAIRLTNDLRNCPECSDKPWQCLKCHGRERRIRELAG